MSPSRLGPYELAGSIGSGGMGQVFEARDTRLGRSVALKVLPADAIGNPEARARFLREARLAAALNHPNIVTIYDADADGTGRDERLYIAMERVTGTTLADAIARRRPDAATALTWAAQIVDAMAHAHAAGVVHRDLKPANVMVTAGGRIKVLDFGLAKQITSDEADPTAVTASLEAATGTGVVLGTIAYMSPEQAEGRRVDARSDLFSFGVLFYELLTGERPFRGDSAASVIGSLLRDTPPAPSAIRPGLPADVDHIVEKALAKNPNERYQHADDLLVDLRAAARKVSAPSATEQASPAGAQAARARRRWLTPAIAAGIALAALAAWAWIPTEAPPLETMRFVSPLPEGFSFENAGGFGSSIALSPDGSTIVLAAHSETEKTSVLLRQKVGDFSAVPIPQTRGARAPFISYDGQWVGFVTGQDVSRVRLAGDAAKDSAGIEAVGTMLEPESLTSVDIAFFGGDFDRKGNTILIGECTRGLRAWSLSAKVKERVSNIAPDALGIFQHQFPQTLPDGEHLLLTAWRNSGAELHLRNLRTGEERMLVEEATYGRYAPSGHIVYAWKGDLYAVGFDAANLTVTGNPVRVLEGVLTETWRGAAHFSLAENGTLAYLPGGLFVNTNQLVYVARDGSIRSTASFPGQGISPAADGRQIVAGQQNGASHQVWTYAVDRQLWSLTVGGTEGLENLYWPLLSPDGRTLWFERLGSPYALMRVAADGSGEPQVVATHDQYIQPQSWADDGRLLVHTRGLDQASGYDIWTLDVSSGQAAPLVATPAGEIHPAVSPDGRWLAYATNASGRFRVVVRPLHSPGPLLVVSEDGYSEPRWSADGRRLYFRRTDGREILAVDFKAGPSPEVGKPAVAFTANLSAAFLFGANWALSPDEQTAIGWLRNQPIPNKTQYVVVLNWLEELKRLVPTS